MTPLTLYALAGAGIFVLGLVGTLGRGHLFWKVLGVNFMGSGAFLILMAASPRLPGGEADPVPQAMVLTGIVVAVSATALALGMALRVAVRTGRPYLSEDLPTKTPEPVEESDVESSPDRPPKDRAGGEESTAH